MDVAGGELSASHTVARTGAAAAARPSRTRLPAVLAWSLWCASSAAAAAGLALVALDGRWAGFLAGGHADAPFPAVVGGFLGALIVSRRPRNAVGWLMLLTGGAQAAHLLANEYAVRALARPAGGLGLGGLASWLSPLALVASAGPLALLLISFPEGSLRGRGRATLAALALADLLVAELAKAVVNWPLRGPELLDGSAAAAAIETQHPLLLMTQIGIGLVAAAAVAMQAWRYRRATGVVRQQLKWFAAGFGATVGMIALGYLVPQPAGGMVALVSPIPGLLGVYVAIRRHRLYEIDRILSRGAAYLLATAAVAVAYVVSATLLAWALGRFAGGATLTVAASAVVAAAVFNPARRRLQDLSDRAFRRRAYEARRLVGRYLEGLAVAEPEPGALREAVAAALDDPTTVVALWMPRQARYVDEQGSPLTLTAADPGRVRSRVDRGGAHIGLLVHEEAVEVQAPGLAKEVARAAVAAFDHARLRAQLFVQLAEVRASRSRIVAAADEQRRRIERDLHDGAQQRLLAIALELSRLERSAASSAAPLLATALGTLVGEVREATSELRELARGLVPPVLTERGLVAALESLAERSAVPARVDGALEAEPPAAVQLASYYVVAEALTNVARHASAGGAVIGLRRDAGAFAIWVEDDGAGGADPGGSGLQGLRDRVEAAGGTLRVTAGASGRGTRVTAEFPAF